MPPRKHPLKINTAAGLRAVIPSEKEVVRIRHAQLSDSLTKIPEETFGGWPERAGVRFVLEKPGLAPCG
jgi:hypothetical protein